MARDSPPILSRGRGFKSCPRYTVMSQDIGMARTYGM